MFKNEPVKKLKKLWESQILVPKPIIDSTSKLNCQKTDRLLPSSLQEAKKWSSMQNILGEPKDRSSSKGSVDMEKIERKSVDDIKSNMTNVLAEIKMLDLSKSQDQDQLNKSNLKTKALSNDSINSNSDLDSTRVVEKLKHKFDNKDQAFIKVQIQTKCFFFF